MGLETPNLDDRTFQDFVDELKIRAGEEFPEWTDHNLSDPGVALLELFAFVAERTNHQLNQVPDRLYTKFLEMMGIDRKPAVSAEARLSFRLSKEHTGEMVLPKWTEVATESVAGEDPIVFSTHQDLRLEPPILVEVIGGWHPDKEPDEGSRPPNGDGTDSPLKQTEADELRFVSLTKTLQNDVGLSNVFWGVDGKVNNDKPAALYLGFQDSVVDQILEVAVRTKADGYGIHPDDPPFVWEICTSAGADGSAVDWEPIEFVDDTGGFNRDGTFELYSMREQVVAEVDGKNLFWLRVRYKVRRQQLGFGESPDLRRLEVRMIGGEVQARHAEVIPEERIGISDGTPGQSFPLRHQGILDPAVGQIDVHRVRVDIATAVPQAEVWCRRVRSFADSLVSLDAGRPGATIEKPDVMWELTDGAIRFGPLIRDASDPAIVAEKTSGWGYVPLHDSLIKVSIAGGPVVERRSTGTPSEILTLSRSELGAAAEEDLQTLTVEVLEQLPQSTWVGYRCISDLQTSAPGWPDVRVIVHPDEIHVEFGDFIPSHRQDRRIVRDSRRQYGWVPPKGAEIWVTGYRIGGGSRGNLPANRLVIQRSVSKGVIGVTNRHPAVRGVDQETTDEAKQRGPLSLQTMGRAVTAADFERLTKDCHQLVERVRVLPSSEVGLHQPTRPGGVTVLVVIDVSAIRRPTPVDLRLRPDVVGRIQESLDASRSIGTELRVHPPRFATFAPVVLFVASSGANRELVEQHVTSRLFDAFHPITGGAVGAGTSFGVDIDTQYIEALVASVPGVDRIVSTKLLVTDENGERVGNAFEVLKIRPWELPLVMKPAVFSAIEPKAGTPEWSM